MGPGSPADRGRVRPSPTAGRARVLCLTHSSTSAFEPVGSFSSNHGSVSKRDTACGTFLTVFLRAPVQSKGFKGRGCVQRVTGHISLPEGVRERETGHDQTRTVLGQQGRGVPLNTGVFSPAWSPGLCTKPLLGHEGRLALTRSQHCNDFVLRTVTGTQSPVTPCWRPISLFLLPPVSLL